MKRILVPLDGSALAERILPLATYLARGLDAELMLLHVVEQRPPENIHGEPHLADRSGAEAYLASVSGGLRNGGVRVGVHVHESAYETAETGIAEHGKELDADFIMLSVHGKAGIKRLVGGTLGQRLAFLGNLPVLLVRSDDPRLEEPRVSTVLVPLSCEGTHGDVVPFVASLAGPLGAHVRLTSVVNTYGTVSGKDADIARFLPSSTASLLDACADDRREQLEEKKRELALRKIEADYDLRWGHTVRRLAAEARRPEVDLVVLSTHGRSGLAAAFEGSVAARLVRALTTPVILVPVVREGE